MLCDIMRKRRNIVILFTCIGRRVSLLRAFRQACSRLGYNSVIIGADTTENSAALQCCDRKYIVKSVFQRGYAQEVIDIIGREKVDILIPTIDLDLPIWAKNRNKLSKTGCTSLVSSPKVVEICQDKRKTYQFLKKHGFDTPEIMTVRQALNLKKHNFPYFLKPWDGHASRKNMVVHNRQELKFHTSRIPNCLVQEFVDGLEHTVDVLVDFDGKVRCLVPRRRIEVRDGEVSKSQTIKNSLMIEQTKALVEALGAGPGVITIQCFLNSNNKVKFIEINPRFGGGVPLSIKAGANFPRWILQLWLGRKPRISMNRWQEGLIMLRFDEAVWYRK